MSQGVHGGQHEGAIIYSEDRYYDPALWALGSSHGLSVRELRSDTQLSAEPHSPLSMTPGFTNFGEDWSHWGLVNAPSQSAKKVGPEEI